MSYTDIQKQIFNLSASLNLIKKLIDKLDERAGYNQTIKELNSLSDRELSDIGISRGDIVRIAKGGSRD
jgi:uncharacterized protein YjiS (DUF1127 family)